MRPSTNLLLSAAAAALLLSLLACSDVSDGGGPCEGDDQCEGGSCRYGTCQSPCPCEDGWECARGSNVLGWPSQTCVKRCSSDASCPDKWRCEGACPAPFADITRDEGYSYSCAEDQRATICEPDRPLAGRLVPDKEPSQYISAEPVTFTLHLLHSGRDERPRWTWMLDDAEIPGSADQPSVTLGPFEQRGSRLLHVRLTNALGQSAVVSRTIRW